MSDFFRNPYHFVPTGPGEPPERLPKKDIEAPWAEGSASAHITHDRYVPGTHSGRITCRAIVETPLICGNRQEERPGWTKLIHPFEIEEGKPALPASSLRGMLSALAEAATHSTLRVLKGINSRKFFRAISADLEPLHDNRTKLTLAEQLFGAVAVEDELNPKRGKNAPSTFALAGRLRVHHGQLTASPAAGAYQDYQELLSAEQKAAIRGPVKDIPLHNLASPKPTAPALYFKPQNAGGGYIAKDQLTPDMHEPLGRKFYLRRRDAKAVRESALFVHPQRFKDTKDLDAMKKQHPSVHRFVRPGCQFEFQISFDNLSPLEFQMLTYILNPSSSFRHQIGHGKPLGLGQMKIEITAVDLVNRVERYANDDLTDSRHHSALHRVPELQKAFRGWAEENQLGEVLAALELLGAPPDDDIPVHYPQAAEKKVGRKEEAKWVQIEKGTPDFETEQFHWFVQNDRLNAGQQYLSSLLGQTKLPKLRRERGRDAAEPGPLQQKAQKLTRPEDFIGGTHGFRVAKLNRNNDKLSFVCSHENFGHINGSLSGPDRKKLLTSRLQLKEGDVLPLHVSGYVNASFQLALPDS